MPIVIETVQGDALRIRGDVLALKFAQGLYGIDLAVAMQLMKHDADLRNRLPPIGEALLIPSENVAQVDQVLFVGVEPLGKFDYETIRLFANQVLLTLQKERPSTEHVILTLHGAGFGLDVAEAFRAEVAGLLDAIQNGRTPTGLRQISIVERDPKIVSTMQDILATILPPGVLDTHGTINHASLSDARSELASVGRSSRDKPLVFVAMPFADEYTDRFHYGINGAVNAAGFLCERADLASFTGDVIGWVKGRIDSAALVVADLSSANPNVYLEVGYAWGHGVNTVLIVAQGDELKFDVRGQRCLIFKSISHLEELLTAELKSLRGQMSQ